MAATRPYFSLSIGDLESIFDKAQENPEILELLLGELSYRKTERAALLSNRIKEVTPVQDEGSKPAPRLRTDHSESKPTSKERVAKRSHQPTAPVSRSVPPASGPIPEATTPPSTKKVASTTRHKNHPASIIEAWSAMEALSPQTYRKPADLANGDIRCVARLDHDLLPWQRGEKSRPNYQLFYQIVLGAIDMGRATEALVKTYGAEDEKNSRVQEKAAIAAILVDREGYLVQENGVAISSFAWALPVALEGNLSNLGEWVDIEKRLVKDLAEKLTHVDTDGDALPINHELIVSAFQWVTTKLQLEEEFCTPPQFSLRIYHYYKAKNPPEVSLLNSFFLNDLAKIHKLLDEETIPPALARYIGSQSTEHSVDLLAHHDLIEQLVAPTRFPQARWPSRGGHPLVTLQQAAVNAVRSSVGNAHGVASVNGPPGTGKTTLLRDVVAACVLDRAEAMAKFEDPTRAFETTGIKVPAGDRAFFHLYRLDSSLKGHEILVASSNNKAVENVSRELPAAKEMGRDFQYFKTVSDRLNVKRDEHGKELAGEPTWGLIAAVLGNGENIGAFQRTVWFDADYSLRIYLKAAKGDSVAREIRDDAGALVRREIPFIVTKESPPSPEEAKAEWSKARRRFLTLKTELDRNLSSLESIRKDCLRLPVTRAVAASAEKQYQCDQEKYETVSAALREMQIQLDLAEQSLRDNEIDELAMQNAKPWWFHQLLHTRRYQNWSALYAPLVESLRQCRQVVTQVKSNYKSTQEAHNKARDALVFSRQELESRLNELNVLEQSLANHRQTLGDHMVDEDFFTSGHERWNLNSPWVTKEIHRKREDLFDTSLVLQRAFINVNAQRVLHNFGALMGAMQAGAFQDPAKLALLPDLWSTLFLICPVVSTTFASVDRMLGDLPPAAFGWLLVDEAGQATPQAAAGAIMRAQRAIVVGDPLQIPPVVSLPTKLTEQIAQHFNLDKDRWLAPNASTQTVADEASYHRAEFQANAGTREVGLPLLVHRRCQNPMFRIANDIAYDGQMVHAAGKPSTSSIADVLGDSCWFDMDGSGDSKWCPAEGELVVDLLQRLAKSGVISPDIYIITPFRIVANELKQRLRQEDTLFETFGVDMDDWLKNRVGTIHTFQGKEAEAVIAVLGAPMKSQQGARNWATSTPNILNVMVSRAQQTMYVIGSKASWSTSGHGRTMSKYMDSN